MPQYTFGTGNIFITPSGANPTPILVGAIQDASVDFDGDLKQLFGQYQYALDNARGKVKITGKFGSGKVDSKLWNATFFGLSVTTGQTLFSLTEAAAIPATPFQVVPANGATFTQDLGVFFAATGLPLKAVASGPTTGQYSFAGAAIGATASFATNVMTVTVAPTSGVFAVGQQIVSAGVTAGTYISSLGTGTGGTGTYTLSSSPGTLAAQAAAGSATYTFATADSGKGVLLNYEYSSSATGQSIAGTNQLMGTIPVFRLDLANNTKGKQQLLTLYACVAPKLQFPLKMDDYGIMTVDFSAQDDGTGRVFNWSTTEG
jgi:hypothetical protein